MFSSLQKSALCRRFSLRCLLLHPLIGKGKPNMIDIKAAEEAIGLIKALEYQVITMNSLAPKIYDERVEMTPEQMKANGLTTLGSVPIGTPVEGYFPIRGRNAGQGFIDISFSSSEEEEEDKAGNEWTNLRWRNNLANDAIISLRMVNTRSFFGEGKLEQLGKAIDTLQPDLVFINYPRLTPLQKKTMSQTWVSQGQTSRVLDRFELILQIFASRAKNNLARYELALAYLHLARSMVGKEGGVPIHYLRALRNFDVLALDEKTTQVSGRQSAGKGSLGGEGEKEQTLLLDQLKVMESRIKKLIEKEQSRQAAHYDSFKESKFYRKEPRVALIGYTNVGKSALLNKLTSKQVVESKDRLFETLRTTAREFRIAPNLKGVVIDTVGFIDQLPTELVNSFGSTLKEVESADVVLLVEDVSHPLMAAQTKVALELLEKLNMKNLYDSKRLIRVWNKSDQSTPEEIARLKSELPADQTVVVTSLTQGTGLVELKQAVEKKVNSLFERENRTLRYPFSQHQDVQNWLFDFAGVNELGEVAIGNGKDPEVRVTVPMALNAYNRFLLEFSQSNKTEGTKKLRQRDIIPEDWIKR